MEMSDILKYGMFINPRSDMQVDLNLPGLVDECSKVLETFNMRDLRTYSKKQWKQLVREKIPK